MATHPREEIFEEYAFDRLRGDALDKFEEHLLTCEHCQRDLRAVDDHIRLMKVGTAAYAASACRRAHGFLAVSHHSLRWNATAAAVILLTCLTALLSWRAPSGDPETVVLEAFRGGDSSMIARAPAGRPLDFQIDLSDVKRAPGYRVEVVDSEGRRVWFGGTPARLTKGLTSGKYWVRLSTDTGEQLREFGLQTGS